jgi:hypothetical protein
MMYQQLTYSWRRDRDAILNPTEDNTHCISPKSWTAHKLEKVDISKLQSAPKGLCAPKPPFFFQTEEEAKKTMLACEQIMVS